MLELGEGQETGLGAVLKNLANETKCCNPIIIHRRPLFEALVMVLLGALLALLASAAGLVTLGSSYILGEVSAVAFAVSLFILICATEART